ncbi:MAG: CAP domain-containing protein [Clostridium celatum]|nr:CAP domain-containing protein [Clostridium celatum]
MFKKKIISSILALGLVTLNVTASNANARIKQLDPPPVSVVLSNEISTYRTTNYSFGKWVNESGLWYYMYNSGAMATGWQLINGNWYYMYNSGAMATGWQLINGNWYYMYNSGAMTTGWQLINGNWYYMYNNGAMAKNTIIDGWKIDSNGVAKKNPEEQNQAPVRTWEYMSSMSDELFRLISDYRVSNGLCGLTYDASIQQKAKTRAEYNAKNSTSGHDDSQISITTGLDSTPQEFLQCWINSPDHNNYMLNSLLTRGGVAVYKDSNDYYYIVAGIDMDW